MSQFPIPRDDSYSGIPRLYPTAEELSYFQTAYLLLGGAAQIERHITSKQHINRLLLLPSGSHWEQSYCITTTLRNLSLSVPEQDELLHNHLAYLRQSAAALTPKTSAEKSANTAALLALIQGATS